MSDEQQIADAAMNMRARKESETSETWHTTKDSVHKLALLYAERDAAIYGDGTAEWIIERAKCHFNMIVIENDIQWRDEDDHD